MLCVLRHGLSSTRVKVRVKSSQLSLEHQPHEGEFACKVVDELQIRLICGEQATFSCPFVTGERSHRNRPSSTASTNDNEQHFPRNMIIVHHAFMILLLIIIITTRLYYLLLTIYYYSYKIFFLRY